MPAAEAALGAAEAVGPAPTISVVVMRVHARARTRAA